MMKPLVNLASEPFRNRRLFWLAIILLFAIPSIIGLRAIKSMAALEGEIVTRTSVVKTLEDQIKKYEKPVTSNVVITPDQNRELIAANELIARRTFSWSQLLNEIERNLPSTVRVLRVSVSKIRLEEREPVNGVSEAGAATLQLEVVGKTGQDVTTMINRFHDSGRFKVSPVQRKSIEGTEEVVFTLQVEYLTQQPAARAPIVNQIAESKQ